MSKLGDLIVEHGPYDETVDPRWGPESKSFLHSDLNALRDELIELRQLRTNALAMVEEYERAPRNLIQTRIVARILRDWCEGRP